jgi:hypothetical protein
MKQTVITIMAAAFLTAGVFGQVTSETLRQRPQRPQLSESHRVIGKVMAEDAEIKKIREKAINAMIKRLVKLGHSEKDAAAVVKNGAKAAERFRSGGNRGAFENRRRPNERQGRDEIKAPKNPLTPGWSVKAERKLKRKKAKRDE